MSKFNIGDRVAYSVFNVKSKTSRSMLGAVVGIDGDMYIVKLDGQGTVLSSARTLEIHTAAPVMADVAEQPMFRLKPGDRIRYVGSNKAPIPLKSKLRIGKTGEVMQYVGSGNTRNAVFIRWDDGTTGFAGQHLIEQLKQENDFGFEKKTDGNTPVPAQDAVAVPAAAPIDVQVGQVTIQLTEQQLALIKQQVVTQMMTTTFGAGDKRVAAASQLFAPVQLPSLDEPAAVDSTLSPEPVEPPSPPRDLQHLWASAVVKGGRLGKLAVPNGEEGPALYKLLAKQEVGQCFVVSVGYWVDKPDLPTAFNRLVAILDNRIGPAHWKHYRVFVSTSRITRDKALFIKRIK